MLGEHGSVGMERRYFVRAYLKVLRDLGAGWAGPTEIGAAFGLSGAKACSAMRPSLRLLTDRGIIETRGGEYRWVEDDA